MLQRKFILNTPHIGSHALMFQKRNHMQMLIQKLQTHTQSLRDTDVGKYLPAQNGGTPHNKI